MRERIEAMKMIWVSDEATYVGQHVNFDPVWSWLKPLQQPHPPILVGGNGPSVLDRVLAYGDEWMPNRVGDDELIEQLGALAVRARESGRSPVPVTIMGLMRDPARIERLERAGVHRGVFWIPSEAAEVEPAMDRYAALAQEYERAGA